MSRIERERSYAELQDTLLGPETLAAKLTELARFVGAERDDALLEPYLVETVDLLIRLLAPGGHGPLELTGLAPADIEPLYRRLESMEASATLKSSLDRAVESLREVLGQLYAWLEDPNALRELFGVAPTEYGDEDRHSPPTPLGLTEDRCDWLIQERDRYRASAPDYSRSLGVLLGRWGVTGGVVAPVIEQTGGGHRGTLRSVNVRLSGGADEDTLSIGSPVYGAASQSGTAFGTARQAARSLVQARHPDRPLPLCTGYVQFGRPAAGHEGDSADLAIAALYATELRALTSTDPVSRFSTDVAMTGRVSRDGAVLSVDEASLPLKVRAAFFSPVRHLVVPEAQWEDVNRLLKRLREAYPTRHLSVVGVRHLRDVVREGGGPKGDQRPAPTAGITRSVPRIALCVGLIAVVAMATSGAPWRLLSRPTAVHTEGGRMVVTGRLGYVVDVVPLDPRLISQMEDGTTDEGGQRVLFNLKGDESVELVWWDLAGTSGRPVVKAKRPGQPGLDWETPLPAVLWLHDRDEDTPRVLIEGVTHGQGHRALVYVREEGESLVVLDGATGCRISTWARVRGTGSGQE